MWWLVTGDNERGGSAIAVFVLLISIGTRNHFSVAADRSSINNSDMKSLQLVDSIMDSQVRQLLFHMTWRDSKLFVLEGACYCVGYVPFWDHCMFHVVARSLSGIFTQDGFTMWKLVWSRRCKIMSKLLPQFEPCPSLLLCHLLYAISWQLYFLSSCVNFVM